MTARFNPFLLRLSRWPRRIAALVCLLLAAASTLAPAGTPEPPARRAGNPIAAGLSAGQVAVPVAVASGRAISFVRTGDRVGVFAGSDETARAGPELVADGLRVLAVSGVSGPDDAMTADAPVLVVAADRAEAMRLAASAARPLLVVVDKSP